MKRVYLMMMVVLLASSSSTKCFATDPSVLTPKSTTVAAQPTTQEAYTDEELALLDQYHVPVVSKFNPLAPKTVVAVSKPIVVPPKVQPVITKQVAKPSAK